MLGEFIKIVLYLLCESLMLEGLRVKFFGSEKFNFFFISNMSECMRMALRLSKRTCKLYTRIDQIDIKNLS